MAKINFSNNRDIVLVLRPGGCLMNADLQGETFMALILSFCQEKLQDEKIDVRMVYR